MNDIREMTLTGSVVNGTLASFFTIITWQPLFKIKNSIMTGGGFPPINRGLYKGYPINACCDISNQSVAFFSNHYFSTVIMNSKPLTPMEQIVGGLFSGMAASPLLCICDRIMVLQQQGVHPETQKPFTSVNQVVRSVLKFDGVRGLVRGFVPTVMREATNAACFFGLQKSIKTQTEKWISNKDTASSVAYLVSGLLSGILTTPADLLKTNMQKTLRDSSSVFTVASDLIKQSNQGLIRALFRGGVARSVMMGCLMSTMGPLSGKIQQFFPDTLFKEKTT